MPASAMSSVSLTGRPCRIFWTNWPTTDALNSPVCWSFSGGSSRASTLSTRWPASSVPMTAFRAAVRAGGGRALIVGFGSEFVSAHAAMSRIGIQTPEPAAAKPVAKKPAGLPMPPPKVRAGQTSVKEEATE